MEGENLNDRRRVVLGLRQMLVGRGFRFCDEGDLEEPQFPLPEASPDVERLVLEGVEASSTDNVQQGIACTLEDWAETFWSSSGSLSPDSNQYLVYKLKSPLCMLRDVQLIVFRARYQFGEPLYPPSHISFQVGPSPWNLAPPSIKYTVAATDAVQSFPMPADLPVGRYLRINLHGAQQQQLEDMQWYHAVQRVEAFGRRLSATGAAQLRDWMALQLNPPPVPGAVPSYVAASVVFPQQQEGEKKE